MIHQFHLLCAFHIFLDFIVVLLGLLFANHWREEEKIIIKKGKNKKKNKTCVCVCVC